MIRVMNECNKKYNQKVIFVPTEIHNNVLYAIRNASLIQNKIEQDRVEAMSSTAYILI